MKAQLLKTLNNSRAYTLAVAAAMPDKGYDSKPVQELWSFGELLNHIGYGIAWWESNFIRQKEMAWEPPVLSAAKAEVTEYLEAAYGLLEKTVNGTDLTDEAVQGFHATIDHITHHRGQATIYLRHNGITPPEYVY